MMSGVSVRLSTSQRNIGSVDLRGELDILTGDGDFTRCEIEEVWEDGREREREII